MIHLLYPDSPPPSALEKVGQKPDKAGCFLFSENPPQKLHWYFCLLYDSSHLLISDMILCKIVFNRLQVLHVLIREG